MNNKLRFVLAIALLSGTSLYAADSKIGTDSDPLVTKSYVDAKIAQVSGTSSVNSKVAALEELVSKLSQEIAELEASKSSFEVVNLAAGKIIYGKQGSEMIVRAGTGNIVASSVGGVQDVTDGVDLAGGAAAPKNNLLIVPREDGRGIMAQTDMVIMVRGGYTIL